jgi:hypothetical protein
MIERLSNWWIAMDLEKIKTKLVDFFESSEHTQNENQEKLTKIIHKLKTKKQHLKEELAQAGEQDETSVAYSELEKEYKVVCKLLKKAKKNYQQEMPESEND